MSMDNICVFKTVWDDCTANGCNLYVLYTDNTYERYHFDVKSFGTSFKKFINARIMAFRGFNKEQVKKYLDEKLNEWTEEKET